MNCYKHIEHVAMSICCGCGRALCTDCATESNNNRIVCSTSCANRANQIDDVLLQIQKKQLRKSQAESWFLWLGGVAFLIAGINDFLNEQIYWPFPVGMSVVFLLGGYWMFRLGKKST